MRDDDRDDDKGWFSALMEAIASLLFFWAE